MESCSRGDASGRKTICAEDSEFDAMVNLNQQEQAFMSVHSVDKADRLNSACSAPLSHR